MTKIHFIAVVLLLFSLSLLITPSMAEIKTLKITTDDRPMILFQKFRFTHTGHISVAVSSVSVSVTSTLSSPVPCRFGFFLLSEESLNQFLIQLQQNTKICVLDSKYINRLFTFRSLSPPPHSSFNNTFPITVPNEYSLFFANCAPFSQVTMDVRTELYNLDAGGRVKDYLSVGLTQLPTLFSVFSLIYFGFIGVWFYIIFKNKLFIHKIHLLMSALLVMKTLNLISAAENNHYVKITGTSHGWDVLFYVFKFIEDVLLFIAIVLIGAGWPFLKPILEKKEKIVLIIGIPFQYLANVASIVIGETGPYIKDWVTWNLVFLFVDIVCCCAIMFPVVSSVRSLRDTLKTDGKTVTTKSLGKFVLFRQFYRLVIGYLFFTRIVVFAIRSSVEYKYQWVSNGTEEFGTLVFYMVMFYMFRPHNEDDEEEEVGMKSLGFEIEALMAEI